MVCELCGSVLNAALNSSLCRCVSLYTDREMLVLAICMVAEWKDSQFHPQQGRDLFFLEKSFDYIEPSRGLTSAERFKGKIEV